MKPLIFLKIDTKNPNSIRDCENFFSEDFLVNNSNNFLYVEKNVFFYEKKIIRDNEIFVFGTPIIKNKIDFKNTINLVSRYLETNNDHEIKDINGQFLIFCNNPQKKEITIINDRFNGIPLYYYMSKEGDFMCSNLYYNLIKNINKNEKIKFDNIKILEFLWMNRLMGDQNYDQFSRFLLPATILKIQKKELSLKEYWRPNYTKTSLSQKDISKKYYDLTKKSVDMMTTDEPKKRYGNFLSSGLDSRFLSSIIKPKHVNFTVTFSDNLEFQTAKEISKILEFEHVHLLCPKDHLEKIFSETVELSGGLYNFLDAIFFGFKNQIRDKIDVAFQGHALDFLHYGNYLPSYFLKIFGSKTFIRKLMKINDKNIVEKYLIHGNYYREDGINILDFIKDEYREKSYEKLKNNVQKDIDTSKDVAIDVYDKWEYLLTHTLGRHYSQLNIMSKMTNIPIRTPAFENELFDLHFQVKPEMKIKDLHRNYALKKANQKVGKVISANHGFRADRTPIARSALLVVRKILRIITGNQKYMSPTLKDRTMPNLNIYLRKSKYFQSQIEALKNNKLLQEKLYILDWKKIDDLFNKWKNGVDTDPIFVFSLLTLQEFFNKLYEKK